MHLAIDARCVGKAPTGVANSLLRHLQGIDRIRTAQALKGWRFTVLRRAEDLGDSAFRRLWSNLSAFHYIDVPVGTEGHPAADIWQQWELPRLLRRIDADALYSPAYVGPLRCGGRIAHLVMIHDDMVWSQPRSYPPGFRLYIRGMCHAMAGTADRLLFPSQAALESCRQRLRFPRERGAVIHHGIDIGLFLQPGAPREQNRVVCIASAERRKNHEVLLQAMNAVPQAHLVLIGFAERNTARMSALRRILPQERWTVVPFADENRIGQELARASVLALPSKGEGFGLPVIEGMAAGVPLVLSDIQVFREIAAETARYCDPDDATAWAAALRDTLAGGPDVDHRVALGMERVAGFTVERSAERLLTEVRAAVRSRQRRSQRPGGPR